MITVPNICRSLKEHRKRRLGLTQMDMALKLGVSQARVSMLETGYWQPPESDLAKYLEGYGSISIDEFWRLWRHESALGGASHGHSNSLAHGAGALPDSAGVAGIVPGVVPGGDCAGVGPEAVADLGGGVGASDATQAALGALTEAEFYRMLMAARLERQRLAALPRPIAETEPLFATAQTTPKPVLRVSDSECESGSAEARGLA